MTRAFISNLFRRLGLMRLWDKLQYRRQAMKYGAENRAFRQEHPEVALPPDYMMYESFKLQYGRYYEGGRESAEWLCRALAPHLPERGRLLDWGCGPGRIIRHLPALKGEGWEICGTDYNGDSIEWCRAHLEGIRFEKNGLRPPTVFADGHFQAAYGISILTHLSAEMHRAWIAELWRVLAPGGVLLLTTHGEAFLAKLSAEEQQRFRKPELVVRGKTVEGHRTYAAFQPPAIMRGLFEGFDILAHIPGTVVQGVPEQDVWIVGKKS